MATTMGVAKWLQKVANSSPISGRKSFGLWWILNNSPDTEGFSKKLTQLCPEKGVGIYNRILGWDVKP